MNNITQTQAAFMSRIFKKLYFHSLQIALNLSCLKKYNRLQHKTAWVIISLQAILLVILKRMQRMQLFHKTVFGSVSISNNQIMSKELDRILILTADQSIQPNISLYQPTQGMVFLTDLNYSVFQFTFNVATQKLSFQSIENKYIIYSAKVIFQINQIVITSLFDNNYFVYTLNQNQINQKQIFPNFFCQTKQPFQELSYIQGYSVFRDCNNYVVFLSDVLTSIKIPSSSSYNQIFSQQINNQIILTFIDKLNVRLCSLQYSTILTSNSLNYCRNFSVNQDFTTALVLSNNLLLVASHKYIKVFDISNSRVISQQIAADNEQYSLYNSLNNFALVTVNLVSDQSITFKETLSIQYFQPAIIIKGQVEKPIQFQITVGPIPLIYQTTLTVKVVSQPQIMFQSSGNIFGYIYQGQEYNNSTIYYENIEQFVTGQNLQSLNLKPENKNISNLAIIPFNQSYSTNPLLVHSNYQLYKLDNNIHFNAMLQYQLSPNSYEIQYATINNISDLILQSPINYTHISPIDITDNSGSFTVKSDSTQVNKRIFFPILDIQNVLYMNYLSLQCDTSQNQFSFASDLDANAIVILCGNSISSVIYRPSFTSPFQAQLTNQNVIQLNFPQNTQLMITNGICFIYYTNQITAFDYINQVIIGNTLNLPTLSQKQNIVLFKDSFFIYYQNQSNNAVINQYSYNSFQSSSPAFLRTLYTDSQNMPNINSKPIILYSNTSQQYLIFQQESDGNKYMVYRVDGCSSQNQFYGVLEIESSSLNVYSSNTICQLQQQLNCFHILKNAQISVKVGIKNQFYQSQTLIPFNFTLSQNDQSQTFNFVLRRNTSAIYGLVNQQSPSIQSLKTTLQDYKFTKQQNQVFQLQDGTDPSIYNNNLLGWQFVSSSGQIQNRIQRQILLTDISVFRILQNQTLIVQENQFQIGSLIALTDVNCISCVALEDTSQTIYDKSSIDFQLYFICQSQIAKYGVKIDIQNSVYTDMTIYQTNIYQLSTDIPYPSIYSQIFSTSSEDIRLFGPSKTSLSKIIFDDQQKQATIYQLNLNSQCIISENIIYSFNKLILIFYADGKIITTQYNNIDPKFNNQYNLKKILLQNNFVISKQDLIAQVIQVSDVVFNIQFQQSYIFQVTFSNTGFVVSQIKSFDYLDSFTTLLGSYQSANNQILVGSNQNDQIVINLYRLEQSQNCYTIYGWNMTSFISGQVSVFSISYTSNKQIYSIYLSNKNIYTIEALQNTTIVLEPQQFNQKQFSIFPILSTSDSNQISFVLPQNRSFTSNQQATIILLLLISLFI